MSLPTEIAREIEELVQQLLSKKEHITKEEEAIKEDEKQRDYMKIAVEEITKKINRQKERVKEKRRQIEGLQNNIDGYLRNLEEIKKNHENGMISPSYSRHIEQESAKSVYNRIVKFLNEKGIFNRN
ncbi:hypothetical protein RclHR1_03740014 [Rhizophagus clarus]|uniref:Uncharacterized protein n=1 Tax=Rhizophagus clarus TaxID=94130 RepID=A0A2Z6RSX0_9GLOM|nr:hypothetical protein RclHR1_03740014 [Rhizophagus clarus]GES82861.1 hypothetical protein GLOIN_2v903321 [Rhizophagus clarus]